MPRIIKPTRIAPRSQTLIDNIILQWSSQPNIIAGNITSDISDRLTQFLAIPEDWHTEIPRDDVYRRNYKNLNFDKFKEDFDKIDWATLFSVKNIDVAYDFFLQESDKLTNK